MKETKDELRIKINELQNLNRKLELENAALHKQFAEDLEKQKIELENLYKEKAYQEFIRTHGEFLTRFIRENISIKADNDYDYAYDRILKVNLMFNDEEISSDTAYL